MYLTEMYLKKVSALNHIIFILQLINYDMICDVKQIFEPRVRLVTILGMFNLCNTIVAAITKKA